MISTSEIPCSFSFSSITFFLKLGSAGVTVLQSPSTIFKNFLRGIPIPISSSLKPLLRVPTHRSEILISFIIICLFCIFIGNEAGALKNVIRIKKIELRGVIYLSKYEIIGDTVTKIENNYMAIDIDSLSNRLRKNKMILSYRILVDGDLVRIIIAEREPVFLIGVVKNKRLLLFELDRNFNVISYRRVHSYDKPIIIVSNEDVKGGVFSKRIVDFLKLLHEIKASKLAVYGEISEIDLRNFVRARLHLHGRKTEFVLNPKWESFKKLNYYVAYLDRIGYYPDNLKLFDDFVLMR